MSTLGAMKAEIADDLDRTDLTSQIATAITAAIRHYRDEPFWFNETRNITFATVADQSIYTTVTGDVTSVADITTIYDAFRVEAGRVITMCRRDISEWEMLADAGASKGQPYTYSFLNDALHLDPIPDSTAYTIRLHGKIRRPAPSTDGETGNVWMVQAYELIRTDAKRRLAAHTIRDPQLAADMAALAAEELSHLYAETSRKVGAGQIEAW